LFTAFTTFTILFVLVIPVVAWKSIKKQASENQNRSLSLQAIFERIKNSLTYFKLISGVLSSGLNWLRHYWWDISGHFISERTGDSSAAYQYMRK